MQISRKAVRRITFTVVLISLIILIFVGLDVRLSVKEYYLTSNKVTAPVRLAVLTDLHSCNYGENQIDLLQAVYDERPDVVLLGGDIVDDEITRMDPQRAYQVMEQLAQRYPTYYVSGNHEVWGGDVDDVKSRITELGVTVLEGEWVDITVADQALRICGIDDPAVGASQWQSQLDAVGAVAGEGSYTVLISHRPERVTDYEQYPFDLVVAGHAHGGQWRIPGLINGVMAPDQGFFPQYAGGLYDLEQGQMVVSRGLSRESTRVPRLFNRPELVMVEVRPPS